MTGWGNGYPCVLQVLPALETGGGGVERSTIDVAGALVAAGARSLVASAGGAQLRELERAGVTHIELPLKSKSPLTMRGNLDRLLQIIDQEGVDIVHARSRAPAWSALAAANRTRRIFVTTFHGTYNAGNPLKRFYNSVMARGDLVIANSQFIADHVQQKYRIASDRVRVIPRGVDMRVFAPDAVTTPRMVKLATDWALPDGVPIIMLPGRLTRWKGQELLIDAVARLADHDFVCLLIGAAQRPAYRRTLESLIARQNLGGKLRLLDHCPDMGAAYMLADIVVSGSTDPEAFGRVVAEAQAMGRIVVAPAHGGALEQVTPGQTGFLYDPGDAGALAASLDQALSLPAAERGRIAAAAVRQTEARYSKESMCRDTLAVYRELLATRTSKTAA